MTLNSYLGAAGFGVDGRVSRGHAEGRVSQSETLYIRRYASARLGSISAVRGVVAPRARWS